MASHHPNTNIKNNHPDISIDLDKTDCKTASARMLPKLFFKSIQPLMILHSPSEWSALLISPDNSSLIQVVWRKFNCYLVPRQDSDKIHSELSADFDMLSPSSSV